MQPRQLDQLAEKIEALLPPGLKQVKQDIDGKLKTLLQQQLANMEFVSREEFDIQTKVLARTRQKVNELEKRLQQLLDEQQDKPAP
jgi:BMFP domain-containing protein YqiC